MHNKKGPAENPAGPFHFPERPELLLLRCLLGRRSGSRSRSRRRPVVQVVGDIVAHAAFRELLHDRRGMLVAMAVLAGRYHLVFRFVAGNARLGLMLGRRCRQESVGFRMAGRAILVRDIGAVGHHLRHVRLVALLAVRRSHLRRVGLVALGALRDLAVYVMTGRAEERGVLALVLLQLLDLVGMAGQARLGDLVAERDFQGAVRVLVAAEAVGQLVVGLILMAHAALGDCGLHGRAVADVATGTADFLVLSSSGVDIGRRRSMTFGALFVAQLHSSHLGFG